MNDKCASGTGATIDKCIHQGRPAARRGRASSHFDDSKLHHVAAKCGVFAETDIVNLVKSGIPSQRDPVLARRRDRHAEPVGADARQHAASTRCCCSAGRTPTCRSCRSAGASASPRPGTSAATTTRRTCPIEELIFVPENAQYYAAFGAVRVRPARGGERRRLSRARAGSSEFITNGRKARLGETRRARRSSRTTDELDAFRELYTIPKFDAADARARARSYAASSASTAARRRRKAVLIDERRRTSSEGVPALEGQPDPGHEGAPRRAARRTSTDQGATLEVIGLRRHRLRRRRARGVASRADVNIVETVAHMMAAMHFFGDVDVICDIGGQDIKVLFMKNGDIQNFRLSNQCSAGNGMLLQAMADQFGVPVTEYADVAFKARARAEVQLRLRRLPRHRSRELPEGGLLEGGAARRPRAGAAEERLAVRRADPAHGGARHASSCSRAARSTTWPRVKAQVDYIKERVPGAEVFVHPHTRRGRRDRRRDRDAARRQAARARRRSSASTPRSTSSTRRRTTKRRAATSARTSARARSSTRKTPDGATTPLHRGLLLREGHRRDRRRRCSRSSRSARRSLKQFPNLVDYESKRAFRHFYDPAPMPADGAPIERRRGREGASSACSATAITRPFQRSIARELGSAPARCASASRACSTSTRPAPFFRTYFEALGLPKQNVVFSDDDHRGDVGRGRQVRLDRPLLPVEGRAGAHPQPALPPPHATKKPLNVHLLPDPHARARASSTNAMDNDVAARSSPARPRS